MTILDAARIHALAACDELSVEALDSVGSTNESLMNAPFGAAPRGPRLLAAAAQTAGHGRRGRGWVTEPGRAVAFSIAFERSVVTQPPPAALSIAVGVAAARALEPLAPDVQLKWPNDLQRARRKLGGILVESRRIAPGEAALERVVVGIGLNLLAPRAAAAVAQPACGLFDAEPLPEFAAESVIGLLAAAIVPAVAQFMERGLAPFLDDWRRFDALEGEAVALIDGERTVATGRAAGLDASGGLRFESADGMRVVSSGEVSLRRIGTA
ncbi:MAG: biotin--[acetyl-CoA-carboxylase] ligase [Burkholderiales bacterium]|nr:biotin--[acetyl-CoA-carboxylase] ligase [Burkholderiales bacterium]